MTFYGFVFDSTAPLAVLTFFVGCWAWGLIAGGVAVGLAAAVPGRRVP